MKSPITYYGGKKSMLKIILPLIPSHKIYCEPFFGGGAVFFAKRKSYLEVINDINDRLITFYEVCRDENLFQQLYDKIQSTLHSEKEHAIAKAIWNCPDIYHEGKVGLAWAVWMCTNLSFNASAEGGWKWDNGTCRSHSGVVFANCREQFNEAIKLRLKHVQISCRDALCVIKQRDSHETFFYLDPPYPNRNQGHYKGYTEENFDKLLEMLSGIKGKFILSNFDSDLLHYYVLKNGWNICAYDMAKTINNKFNAGSRKKEILVYNYEIANSLF